jgi:hypothetical protein
MADRYELRSPDGDDLGTFTTSESRWHVGDEFRASGNARYRVTAIVPRERMAEFVDRAEVDVWEVEPL